MSHLRRTSVQGNPLYRLSEGGTYRNASESILKRQALAPADESAGCSASTMQMIASGTRYKSVVHHRVHHYDSDPPAHTCRRRSMPDRNAQTKPAEGAEDDARNHAPLVGELVGQARQTQHGERQRIVKQQLRRDGRSTGRPEGTARNHTPRRPACPGLRRKHRRKGTSAACSPGVIGTALRHFIQRDKGEHRGQRDAQSAPLASMRAVQRFLSFETANTTTPTSSSATMTPQVAADTSANSENMMGTPLSIMLRNS